ncbi:hypothetical protein FEMY_23520 [Ferrovum myxofaciens]|uniref:Uncharacterized protein n=1 Tax=Ferrovum myxofaciens TaxID=416213 RepID=A0A149VV78_9PROT|nr:hypothetical protein FEMY_23520 [Ferrovum myxofaciens]
MGLLQILRRHGTVSAELMAWICDRPSLTATQFRTFLEVGPKLMERRSRNYAVTRTGDLSRYAAVVGAHCYHKCNHAPNPGHGIVVHGTRLAF